MPTTPTETSPFAPLRDRLAALRRQILEALAEQPDDGSLDAGLLALVANVQTALVAVDETIAARAAGVAPWTGRRGLR